VTLQAPAIAAQARPGQFILIRCADPAYPVFDPYLPRAFFVFAADRAGGRLSLLVAPRGRGSAWLAGRRDGDRVLVYGPSGREVAPARLTRHLLLLADGAVAVAGLALLASEAATRGLAVSLVENVPAPEGGVPPELLRADVEYRATTPDGGGLLGALPGLLPWADEVVIAAPWPLLETVAAWRGARLGPFTLHAALPVQALPLPDFLASAVADTSRYGAPGAPAPASGGDYVPCGTGMCGVCVVPARGGPRLFCRDGPAFALEALRFDAEPETPGAAADEP
jgi:hypothetical protein